MMDLPGPAIKAVLAHAGPEATAAFRLANRSAAAAATDAARGLSITLTPSTDRAAVDAWLRATRRMAHAPRLTVNIHGACPTEALDLLLAKAVARGAPRTVVLRGAAGGSATAAASVLARLTGVARVVLIDVALRAGNNNTEGGDAAVASLLAPLAGVASLRRLDLGSGWAGGAALQAAVEALAPLAALPRLAELRCALPAPALALPPAALAAHVDPASYTGAQLREAGAALLAALAPLQHLRALHLSGLPDLWDPRYGAANIHATETPEEGEEADAPIALPTHFEGLGAVLGAALPRLAALDVSLTGGWAMGWRAAGAVHACNTVAAAEEEAVEDGFPGEWEEVEKVCCGAGSGASAAAPLVLTSVDAVGRLAPRAGARAAAAAGPDVPLADRLAAALAPYHPRPASAAALAAVRSLQLTLAPADMSSLAAVLRMLPSLTALRAAVMATAAAGPAPLGALVAAAAAGAPALVSLTLVPGLGRAVATAEALAPLASLPRLLSLKLVGALECASACAAAAEAAWAPLRRLPALERLAVHGVARGRAALPAAALPPSLTSLDLKGVSLLAPASRTAVAPPSSCAHPALASVSLVGCDLPAGAAATLPAAGVRSAVIAGTRLGAGGWHGVAAAWPGLASLRASFEGLGAGNAEAAGAAEGLLAALAGGAFSGLGALAVQRLPRLDGAALAALLASPRLRRLAVTAAGCELTSADAALVLTAPEAGVPARLKAVSLHLPARHLPRHVQQMLTGAAADADAATGAPAAAAPEPFWAMPAGGAPGGALQAALAAAMPGAAVSIALNVAPMARPTAEAVC